MALPEDGSPMLEGHPDYGKDHGKVWSNEVDMVSEDHGEVLRCSSPPQFVDCATSFSGSAHTSSSEDLVGHAGTTSSSGSSTTSSSEDEADNEDQDDFISRLCFVKVLVGKLQQSLKHLNSTIEQRGYANSSSTVYHASAVSQLLEILPPNFKYIQDIGVAQKPQEDLAPCTSLEFTFGLDKQEEPLLPPENSRPIGTSQHHQVGLEEDGVSLTSSCTRSTTKMVDAAEEDSSPSKLSFGTVLPSSFKFTSELDKQEEPILHPEDSSPISASSQPLAGWKNLVASLTFGHARKTTKKEIDVKEDDPTSNPSHQVGLKEDATHVTFVTGINGKTVDSDGEEQFPAKRTGDTVTDSNKWTRDCDDEFPSKRTRDTVAEEEPPAKRSKDTLAEKEISAKKTRDSIGEEELPAKTTKYSDDPSWEEVLQRIGKRMAWRCGKEWEDKPIPSTPLFIPYRKTDHEDPILLSPVLSPLPRTSCEDPVLSSPVLSPLQETIHENLYLSSPDFSPSQLTHCENPILSPRVFSPSPSTHWENSTLLSPGFFFWTEPEGDIEEEPTPSTSGGITARVSSVWFRPRYVLSSDSD
ncbi:uncharacterized protein LOC129377316 [Poeciliopsis prolifica]|uniref:uncharacterized protein LOC129377316 n=1 Tax=Poeciliopsis prolifica TaxID=188132 RepID=UPI0024145D62|nr:uncharacterized protein LOC129377316 [Poeciliopsis prolifica]XP_054913157.1 uncharacterized protein LOC129377316 [Poeciliopsis prolifica]XP_054913158.1 uncharacterized protein LOC129377316 [Poeciliopsis prolifica]XP_054913159.1 uncharacterized protein LOC129377316 [Poeciliopsis prolifica]